MSGQYGTQAVADEAGILYRAPYRIRITRSKLRGEWRQPIQDPRFLLEMGYALTRDLDTEVLLVLGMDLDERPLFVQELYRGTARSVVTRPAEIFRAAVIENATRIVVIHNHPGGSPFPSQEDRALLERLRFAGKALGIEVYDFQVVATQPATGWSAAVGDTGYFVRSENGEWTARPVLDRSNPAEPGAAAPDRDADAA